MVNLSAGGPGGGRRSRNVVLLALVALSLWWTPGTVAAADLEDLLWDLQIVPLDGEDAPGFTLQGLEGTKVSLAEMRGKAILIYFWATW